MDRSAAITGACLPTAQVPFHDDLFAVDGKGMLMSAAHQLAGPVKAGELLSDSTALMSPWTNVQAMRRRSCHGFDPNAAANQVANQAAISLTLEAGTAVCVVQVGVSPSRKSIHAPMKLTSIPEMHDVQMHMELA